MNGAESLARTLVACGVEVCFANPGTSEMHFVAALDRVEGIRCVLGLFEGVVTGAADGYGRMADKPAATLLHLGPGLGNGLANLHNANKAMTPLVNIVGDHATYHLRHDAPLTADIEGIAGPVSQWLRTSSDARSVAADGADLRQFHRAATEYLRSVLLLKSGADAFATTEAGRTALMFAVTQEIVKALVKAGVDVNAVNNMGLTALDGAIDMGYNSVVAFRIEAGAEEGAGLRPPG